MKKTAFLFAALLLTAAIQAAPIETFRQARKSYDAGDYTKAIEQYELLLNDGISNLELRYNLANAHFRAGHIPEAVQYYRNAWYESPADPDIRANLQYALNAAGAVEPTPTFVERSLTSLSKHSWIRLATAGYILLAILLSAAFLSKQRARAVLLKTCLVPTALLIFSAAGWWQWHSFYSATGSRCYRYRQHGPLWSHGSGNRPL